MAGRIENLKPWPKGVSGNLAGRPKHDLSAEIGKAVFEHNPELIYRAMLKALKKGNARTFAILAERAYGKVTASVEIDVNASPSLAKRLQRARQRVLEGHHRRKPALVRDCIIAREPTLVIAQQQK